MKKLSAILLTLVMVSGLLAGCGGSKSESGAPAASGSSGNKVVKIGVFEPQTGDNGAGGKQEILGMQ